ncbi:MAG: hypothetical protein ABL870_13065 [Sediminibacterium sp.]
MALKMVENPHFLKKQLLQLDAILFFSMAFVCGVYSSSTPDDITLAEIYIGAVLLYFVFPMRLMQLISNFGASDPEIPTYVMISMMYLFFVPSITGGIINSNDIVDFIRDVIPLMYLFIPVFLIHKFISSPTKWLTIFLLAICFIGAA